jgi:hypothetical protein
MDPAVPNGIFYARDDDRPWSYGYPENVTIVRRGLPSTDGLLILEGPSYPTPSSQILDMIVPASFDQWVAADIHVQGQPDWTFIKIHTHGSQQSKVGVRSATSEGTSTLWGDQAETFWTYVENSYNDGVNYRVHYMSAREAYNVVRAAQAGFVGNPYDYRDYIVPKYAASVTYSAGTYALESWSDSAAVLRRQVPVKRAVISIRRSMAAPMAEESQDDLVWMPTDGSLTTTADGSLQLVDGTPSEYYRFGPSEPPVNVSQPVLLLSDRLAPGAPNPFRQSVTLRYEAGKPTPLRLELYDLRGRRVRSLVDHAMIVGAGSAVWDGRDERGRLMPAGVYLCRMTTQRGVLQEAVVFLH